MKWSYSSSRPTSRGPSRPSSRTSSGGPRRSYPDSRASWPATGRDRTPSPDQMRYQVIGRTTDESDLIVQISPAFYEYVRTMAHQWGRPSTSFDTPQRSQYWDKRWSWDKTQYWDKEQYGKFNHPYHKEPLHTSYDKKPSRSKSWDRDSNKINLEDIDKEMDDEYEMIKRWFANIDKKWSKKPYIKSSKTFKPKATSDKPTKTYQDKR